MLLYMKKKPRQRLRHALRNTFLRLPGPYPAHRHIGMTLVESHDYEEQLR